MSAIPLGSFVVNPFPSLFGARCTGRGMASGDGADGASSFSGGLTAKSRFGVTGSSPQRRSRLGGPIQ